MPRAPRRCAKAGCNNIQPCPLPKHQRGWGTAERMPAGWGSIVTKVKKRDGHKGCAFCRRHIGLEVDHIIERSDGGSNDLENLRLLCKSCHKQKTIDARRKRR